MTVQGLLDAFAAKAGEAFDNDRVLLSTAEDKEKLNPDKEKSAAHRAADFLRLCT